MFVIAPLKAVEMDSESSLIVFREREIYSVLVLWVGLMLGNE
jgi:hypothetical protein